MTRVGGMVVRKDGGCECRQHPRLLVTENTILRVASLTRANDDTCEHNAFPNKECCRCEAYVCLGCGITLQDGFTCFGCIAEQNDLA